MGLAQIPGTNEWHSYRHYLIFKISKSLNTARLCKNILPKIVAKHSSIFKRSFLLVFVKTAQNFWY